MHAQAWEKVVALQDSSLGFLEGASGEMDSEGRREKLYVAWGING